MSIFPNWSSVRSLAYYPFSRQYPKQTKQVPSKSNYSI